MKSTLIFQYNNVLKKSLLNLGFSNKELKQLVYQNVLHSKSEEAYLILNKEEFQLIILKKILEFGRVVLTDDELEFLNIDPIIQKRLFAYGIAKRIDLNRICVTGDINKLTIQRPEIDMVLYKKLYKESLFDNNYILAKEYLQKYIEICEVFNIEGDYYYALTRVNNNIERQVLDDKKMSLYCQLRKKHKNLNVKKDPEAAVAIAFACYKINPGSIEAAKVGASQLALKNIDYDRCIAFFYESIEKDNLNPYAYRYLGKLYLKMKMYKEARPVIEKYICLDKNCNYDGYVDLFNLYLETNEVGLAHNLFERMISIFSKKNSKKIINECIKIIKRCITKEINSNKPNLERVTELNNLKSTIIKEISFGVDVFGEIEQDNKKYSNLEQDIIELLKPNDNNIIDTKLVDSYILNLDVSEEEKNLIILRSSLVLARNNYFDKANSYIVAVEKNKQKSNFVKQQLDFVRKEIKLIKRKK